MVSWENWHPNFIQGLAWMVKHCSGITNHGALTQLVECLLCKQNVRGSIPLGSTVHCPFGNAHMIGTACWKWRLCQASPP